MQILRTAFDCCAGLGRRQFAERGLCAFNLAGQHGLAPHEGTHQDVGIGYRDMPRGRKRVGWKKEFLEALSEAAKDIGEISEEEIQRTIRNYRVERRMPEITVAAKT